MILACFGGFFLIGKIASSKILAKWDFGEEWFQDAKREPDLKQLNKQKADVFHPIKNRRRFPHWPGWIL